MQGEADRKQKYLPTKSQVQIWGAYGCSNLYQCFVFIYLLFE
jgi:hypothetical protein